VTGNAHCDPRIRLPSLPANVAELVKKATAQDPRDRFTSARQMGAAVARALLQIGAASKEREVTAALSAVLSGEDPPEAPDDADAVPQAVEPSEPSGFGGRLALSEVEMFEASGPIRRPDDDVPEQAPDAETAPISIPLPPEAFRPQPAPPAATKPGPHDRGPGERAVELFDLGIALRAQRRYREALDAWQQALALAPDNLVYQANVQRLRAQLGK
jgi:tetratricopeptide (TPR) repeat protein